MRIFDAGCGSGRNLVYFLRNSFEVFGTDSDAQAIQSTRRLAASLAPGLPENNFRAEKIESTTFPDALADVVVASAILHFARDDSQFQAMLHGMWRVLKTRWVVLLPARILDRDGGKPVDVCRRRSTLSPPRRLSALPRR